MGGQGDKEGGGSDSSFRKGKRTSYVTFDGKKEKLLQKIINFPFFVIIKIMMMIWIKR